LPSVLSQLLAYSLLSARLLLLVGALLNLSVLCRTVFCLLEKSDIHLIPQ